MWVILFIIFMLGLIYVLYRTYKDLNKPYDDTRLRDYFENDPIMIKNKYNLPKKTKVDYINTNQKRFIK